MYANGAPVGFAAELGSLGVDPPSSPEAWTHRFRSTAAGDIRQAHRLDALAMPGSRRRAPQAAGYEGVLLESTMGKLIMKAIMAIDFFNASLCGSFFLNEMSCLIARIGNAPEKRPA